MTKIRNGLTCAEAGKLGGLAAQETILKKLNERKEEYEKSPKFCEQCKIIKIPYNQKNTNRFCSHSCAATFSNLKRSRKKELICKMCKKLTLGTGKIYCSSLCQVKYQNQQKIFESENGGRSASAQCYKRYLIWNFGAKCMKCGWNEIHSITNKVPIELNHIDGNSENNKLANLEIICPNCHSLTPNFKGLNAGNGRVRRRERYRQNKSF